mmetsp:Transcript_5461/g.8483  ORF Transcript_5461/g.8483 Transcript_5461/m.8483 type:complete len:98 (-) Transcript_5461:826-1119(-)
MVEFGAGSNLVAPRPRRALAEGLLTASLLGSEEACLPAAFVPERPVCSLFLPGSRVLPVYQSSATSSPTAQASMPSGQKKSALTLELRRAQVSRGLV